jgi:hypothetical protein
MTSIKIECGCGQRYAFDVEPVDGRMPYTVACPICGADGTGAANEVIAQSVQPESVAAGPSRLQLHDSAAPAVRVAEPVHAAPTAARTTHTRTVLLPGQTDPGQVAHEARAKISWGDAPLDVVKFLMANNIPREEAIGIVRKFSAERFAQIRKSGIGKILVGGIMVSISIGAWFIFNTTGLLRVKRLAVIIFMGVGGVYLVIKGIVMLVAPKAHLGDVSEQ